MGEALGGAQHDAAMRPKQFAYGLLLSNAAPMRVPVVQRGALQVVAAEPDKEKKVQKRTPAPVKRAQLSEERRMYNKARKSACATRIKKVDVVALS
jgi:hypothetical protein